MQENSNYLNSLQAENGGQISTLTRMQSSPELENELDSRSGLNSLSVEKTYSMKDINGWAVISTAMHIKGLEQIPSTVHKLYERIGSAIPEVTRVPSDTKIYFKNQYSLNMFATLAVSKDNTHAVGGLIVTPQVLYACTDWTTEGGVLNLETFSAFAAHEISHNVIKLNPWLLTDSKYQPRSKEYFRQKNEILSAPLTEQEKKMRIR